MSSWAHVGSEDYTTDPAGGTSVVAHDLDGAKHTVSGLTPGYFLKATGAGAFGFVAHGLVYGDVGAAPLSHTHDHADVLVGAPCILGRSSAGAGATEEIGTTGSGNVALATSPVFVTPTLGVAQATQLGIGFAPTVGLEIGGTSDGKFSNWYYGSNLATGNSSTFASGIGSWQYWYGAGVTLAATGGKGVLTTVGAAGGYYLDVMTTGKRYTLTVKLRLAAGTGTLNLASGASGSFTGITATEATFTIDFTATATGLGFVISDPSTIIEIDDVSLTAKEPGRWLYPGMTTGVYLRERGYLTAEVGANFGTVPSVAQQTLQTVHMASLGNKTSGIFYVASTSTSGKGTLGRFGAYSFWNIDGAGNTFWSWGKRFDGETNAWVRDYTSVNNWLPYLKYGTDGKIGMGGAATNDKTNLVPVPTDLFTFDMATGIETAKGLVVNNGTLAQAVADFQHNGTSVFKIDDADKIGFFNVATVVRQNHIADASGGATVDAEARAAVNACLLALETYGLLKTS